MRASFNGKKTYLMELSHLVNLLRQHKNGSSSRVVISVIRKAIDAIIHYEEVGVIGNLVHSSPNIKKGSCY